MGEPDCCLSCKTAASATIGNRPLRIRTVGGVGGRREYPHASYPIVLEVSGGQLRLPDALTVPEGPPGAVSSLGLL